MARKKYLSASKCGPTPRAEEAGPPGLVTVTALIVANAPERTLNPRTFLHLRGFTLISDPLLSCPNHALASQHFPRSHSASP